MHPEMNAYPCSIVRGGTSKGIFFMKHDLPSEPYMRDKVILAAFGSPDVRQIDGLGGADVLTSKLAVISPCASSDADVDYTFGQVSFEQSFIDYNGNCGNISSAVGPFAIDQGMVPAVEPVTTVRIRQTNSNTILVAEVPVKNGKACVNGDFHIDGVPGTGARLVMDWSGTVGAFTGKLLPTGNPKDKICVNGTDYQVSLVDAGNPLVFISAEDLGMEGTKSLEEIEKDQGLMDTIQAIRSKAAVLFGLVDNPEKAALDSPYNPFFAIVSPSADYVAGDGKTVHAEDTDLTARLSFMLKMHKTYPITGTVCTGAAARIPGTVVWDMLSEEARANGTLRIGHPGGIVPVEAEAAMENNQIRITRLGVYRTARRIMDGLVFIPKAVLSEGE
ncbi:2-methylaconitate cis-trans isomerase PrpF family protein [Enterocloster bolteae]|uniref:2-methylaconitate cis-trans isomerase PrpF family protein n=1 Tax=Enterocloster bolteae TaxID=208479 RepID=UPI00210C8DD0|nr:PrpF domain-containing protein [Enterocloster bolteae]MCQ5146232.1 3-methylitaconate isomerase [Enterocloster bolteae]